MVKIIWTELALEDIQLLHTYISHDSKLYADRFVAKIINRIERLENFPNLGRVVPEFNVETIRELIEGNYRIVYQMFTDKVAVLRIHHAAKQLG